MDAGSAWYTASYAGMSGIEAAERTLSKRMCFPFPHSPSPNATLPSHLHIQPGALAHGAKGAAQDGGEHQVQSLGAIPGPAGKGQSREELSSPGRRGRARSRGLGGPAIPN